jgi:hypothetical protein
MFDLSDKKIRLAFFMTILPFILVILMFVLDYCF